LLDFNAVLRRARENAAKPRDTGATDATGKSHKENGRNINVLENRGQVAPVAVEGDTRCNLAGSIGSTIAKGDTAEVLPRNAIDNKELDKQVAQVAPVAYRSALAEFKDNRPHGVTRLRHDQACWAAEMFLGEWGAMAAEFSWSADDIFAHNNGLARWLGVELATALGPEHAVTETRRIYDRVTHTDWLAVYGTSGNG